MANFCEYCGAELPEEARFCESCGQPVEGSASPQEGAARPVATRPRSPGSGSPKQGKIISVNDFKIPKEAAMKDFLAFRTMVTPVIIQVIFWVGVVGSILVGIIMIIQGAVAQYAGGGQVLTGLVAILFGPLVVRIYCEILIIFFRINETLTEIKHTLEHPVTEPANIT